MWNIQQDIKNKQAAARKKSVILKILASLDIIGEYIFLYISIYYQGIRDHVDRSV